MSPYKIGISKFLTMVLLVISFIINAGCGQGEDALGVSSLDPAETLTISGVQWGPPRNFNPFPGNPDAGIDGLAYETLFHFDIHSGRLVPWIAESGAWTGDSRYTMTLRDGMRWTDGTPITIDDLIFTFTVAKRVKAIQYSSIWDWLSGIEKSGDRTIVLTFNNPRYDEWEYWLYNITIVPKHVWEKSSAEEIMGSANVNGVSSGPYRYGRALEDRMILVRNEDWWGNKVFGKPAPKYVVFPIVTSNSVALGSVMKGDIDLCNNFLPGLEKIKADYNLLTYYKNAPFNLPANTAMLFLNCRKPPLDNPAFRRALAFAIDKESIVTHVYGRQVQSADPTGLIPLAAWKTDWDADVAKKYGFSYQPQTAKRLLDGIGVVDLNNDGYREDASGQPLELSIIVPNGWNDWMESIKIIASNLEAVGINAVAKFPDFGVYWNNLTSNQFDMAINNFNTKISATPYTYWHCVAYNEISREKVDFGNFGRYDNAELFDMIERFNRTGSDPAQRKKVASRIQAILLEEMPSIPLWFNGFWAAYTSIHWTNWPSEENPHGIPTGWADFWQMGGLEMLLNLKPAGK